MYPEQPRQQWQSGGQQRRFEQGNPPPDGTTQKGIDGKVKAKEWIIKGINQEAITFAEEFAKYLQKKGLTTSQIRAAFGEVRRIQMRGINETFNSDLLLLKPKLAYAEVRKSGVNQGAVEAAKDIRLVLSAAIDAVIDGDTQTK